MTKRKEVRTPAGQIVMLERGALGVRITRFRDYDGFRFTLSSPVA